MNEITQIDVLPCRDIEPQTVTGGPLGWPAIIKWNGDSCLPKPKTMPPESVVKDRISQDVVVGDVLWWHGKFGTVDRLDCAMNIARLDGVNGRWAALDESIRCPRPGEHMPQFSMWPKLRDAMLADGADIQMLGGGGPGSIHRSWIRMPDCTWRKPHLGAELKDAQSECVGY